MNYDMRCPVCNSAMYECKGSKPLQCGCPICIQTWPANLIKKFMKVFCEYYTTHDMGGPIHHKKSKEERQDEFKFWTNENLKENSDNEEGDESKSE